MSQTPKSITFSNNGASVRIARYEDNIYHLSNLWSLNRGEGHAKYVMQRAVEYADKKNLILKLVVNEYGNYHDRGLDNSELIVFYRKFGFIENPFAGFPKSMVRHPKN